MGGLMFILGIAVAMMGCLPVFYSLGMEETLLMKVKVFAGLGMAVAFGAIGFMDDYIGIVKSGTWALRSGRSWCCSLLWRRPIWFLWPWQAQHGHHHPLCGEDRPVVALLPPGCHRHCGRHQRRQLYRRHRRAEHHGFLLCLF